MPTVDELNAGFNVANTKINTWIQTLLPDHTIPFVGNLRQIAADKLNSAQGRQFLLDEVRGVLVAAEDVRSKSPPSPKT